MTITTSTLTIDDITPITAPAPGARLETVDPAMRRPVGPRRFGRRGVLRTLTGLGTTAGLMALGVFPKAKPAAAACISRLENYIAGGCPTNVGDCSPACGPSLVYAAACNGDYWHQWTGNYRNRPDNCNDVAESDGWRWSVPGCGCSGGCYRTFRCHDGCTLMSGAWRNTICRQQGTGCSCP